MCGIVGIVGFTPVNQQIYDALTVLQHRGQDAAGIMTAEEGELFLRKSARVLCCAGIKLCTGIIEVLISQRSGRCTT